MKDQDKKIGIHKLYEKDPEAADNLLWDREVEPASRRGFLKKSSLLAMAGVVGATIPFADKMPGGLIPAVLADATKPFEITGKEGLRILNDRPVNAETPPHLLDDDFTPAKYFFVRNNGLPPNLDEMEILRTGNWKLQGSLVKIPKNSHFHNYRNSLNTILMHSHWNVAAMAEMNLIHLRKAISGQQAR